MIDIIDFGLGVDQFDKVFYDRNDIEFGQYLLVHFDIQFEFFIHPIPSYFAEVVPLVREEQFVDNSTCSVFVWRFGISQLTVDVLHRFFFGVGRVLLQGVVYDGIVWGVGIEFVQQDGFNLSF